MIVNCSSPVESLAFPGITTKLHETKIVLHKEYNVMDILANALAASLPDWVQAIS